MAIAKIYGGTTLNPILNGAIAPGNIGYTTYNDYPSPNNSGDPAKCKRCSPQAGYPHGFKIIDVYRNAGNHPAVFTSIQSSLKACGITSVGAPQEQGPYYAFIENAANANQWDISEAGWVPDWLGNNGRANVVPLFQTNCVNPTTNYGCYSNPTTDSDIKAALAAPSESAAAPVGQGRPAGHEGRGDRAAHYPGRGAVRRLRLHNLIYSPLAEQ